MRFEYVLTLPPTAISFLCSFSFSLASSYLPLKPAQKVRYWPTTLNTVIQLLLICVSIRKWGGKEYLSFWGL